MFQYLECPPKAHISRMSGVNTSCKGRDLSKLPWLPTRTDGLHINGRGWFIRRYVTELRYSNYQSCAQNRLFQ